MLSDNVVGVVILGGVIGFAAFCLSYGYHVWRRRNGAFAADRLDGPGAALGRWSGRLALLGAVVVAAGLVQRELPDRAGDLVGEDLLTVRAREGWNLKQLHEPGPVETGDLLARFRSPEKEAEIERLTLRRERLRAEKEALQHRPLELDPALVRRRQGTAADRRQLRSSVDQLLPARNMVEQQLLQQRVHWRQRQASVTTRLAETRQLLKQAEARRDHAEQRLESLEALAEKEAGTPTELAAQRKEAKVAAAEVERLRGLLETLKAERQQIITGLDRLVSALNQQAERYDRLLADHRQRLEKTEGERQHLAQKLETDRGRAERLRDHELKQLKLQIRQCEAELAGLQGTLEIEASSGGRIVYRHRSPNTVQQRAPLLVASAGNGLRARVRLPRSEVRALGEAGTVRLALGEALVERRFMGRLEHAETLPDDPSHAVAELVVQPPERAIRDLAAGESVEARLLWRPPITSLPLPMTGLILLALGLIGAAAAAGLNLWKARRPTASHEPGSKPGEPEPVAPAAAQPGDPASNTPVAANADGTGLLEQPAGTSSAELGTHGAVLQMLGGQLRSGILAQRLDPSTLAAVEWALDRHHGRAVRVIGRQLRDDPAVSTEAERLMRHLEQQAERHEEAELRHAADRLARLCRVFDLERQRIDGEYTPAGRSRDVPHDRSNERRDDEDRVASPAGST